MNFKYFIAMISLCLSTSTYAQQAQVTILDPNIDEAEIGKDFKINTIKQTSVLPDKELRDQVFGSHPKLKNWDELKKDIFFMDLRSKDISQLKKKYPELSVEELKAFKNKV